MDACTLRHITLIDFALAAGQMSVHRPIMRKVSLQRQTEPWPEEKVCVDTSDRCVD